MKLVHGWYLPEDDEHFEYHLAQRGPQINGRGNYQYEKIRKTLDVVRETRMAIDVGAHVGFWSYHFAATFRRVASFEPIRELRECFRENLIADNVELYPYAVSNTEGELTLQKPDNSNSGNWAMAFGEQHGVTETVPAYSLDHFNFQDVDLIKIDVEGWEVEVVRGAEQTIKRCRPVITVEQKPGHGKRYGFDDRAAVILLQHWGMRVLWEKSGDVCLGW